MLVFEERGKPDYPEKNLSEQGREPTTNSTHIWCRRRDLLVETKQANNIRYYSFLVCVWKLDRARKKLEFQLVLWVSIYHIFLVWGHFLLIKIINDFVRWLIAYTLAYSASSRTIAQWRYLTTTTRIHFSFPLLFKFVNPAEDERTIALICTRKQQTQGFW